jgi:drug/metabolite transporter (DMT)-like permease
MLPDTHIPQGGVLRGAAFMVLAAACFTIETSLIKLLGPGWSGPNQVFWRQIFAAVFLIPFIWRDPKAAFYTTRPKTIVFRSMAGTTGLFLLIYAFTHLPLATANALSYSRPLWVVVLSVIFLREAFRWSRVFGVIFGFVGVMIVLSPTQLAADNLWPHLAILAAAFCFAVSITSIKSMSANHATLTLLVYSVFLALLFSAPFAFADWRWPDLKALGLFAIMGVASLGAVVFYIKGLACADASLMANFDYVRLIFAVSIGAIVFKEWPEANLWIGCAVIIASLSVMTWFNRKPKAIQAENLIKNS